MASYISKLIQKGENQQLDFKFEISDSRKIARTLSAFSNTDGGTLLIGVKDNGAIAGVRSDEEYFMVEAAATMYCRPQVSFTTKEWEINAKVVLEVKVPRGLQRPYLAADKNGKWLAYVRVKDQNFLANRVLLKVWERSEMAEGTQLRFGIPEKLLLDHLGVHGTIDQPTFRLIASISGARAETILVNMICLGILEPVFSDLGIAYRLTESYSEHTEEKPQRT